MKEILYNEIDYQILIEKVNTFKNKRIIINENWNLNNPIEKNELFFYNCIFSGGPIFIVYDKFTNIYFRNCIFDSNLSIDNSALGNIYFRNSKISNLEINNSKINNLSFVDKCKIDLLYIDSVKIDNKVDITHNDKINNLYLNNVHLKYLSLKILENKIYHLEIIRSTFNKKVTIINNDFSETLFRKNTFISDIEFSNNNLINKEKNFRVGLIENLFKENSFFKSNKGIRSELFIKNNVFYGIAIFNNSIFHSLNMENTTFKEISSFQDTIFDIIKIDRTSFEKNSFFDDIQINEIGNTDRRTIRNIKYQLLRSDNKIDYNRFRSFELKALKKELLKQKKKNWNEIIILSISGFYSDNGLNWIKAIKNTLIISFIIYIILFITLNINNKFAVNLNNLNNFLVGYFRFLIPTELYNPLNQDRKYLANFFQWFILLIGKIIIGIGIYETIRSFRKYKR